MSINFSNFNTLGSMNFGGEFFSQLSMLNMMGDVFSFGNMNTSVDYSALSKDDLAKAQYACQLGTQAASVMSQAVTSVTDSIFSAMNKAQGAKLQAQQQQLDMRKQALESEVQVLSNEYQAVKQGEQSEAKNIAPQFGLA